MPQDHSFLKPFRIALTCAWIALLFGAGVIICTSNPSLLLVIKNLQERNLGLETMRWLPPDSTSIPKNDEGKMIAYGRELVSHTAVYLGPRGKVNATSNGMNCQNCHLRAGTRRFGNNYSAVASTYPKFRERSGTVESIEKRVNDCIERSLNGQALAVQSREMRAIVSYIKWVGKDVPQKTIPEGAGIVKLPYLDRPADPVKGEAVYLAQCARCHGLHGEGAMAMDGVEWKYPPVWGENSFNIGAGLFRLSRFAGYVKVNMPNDLATYEKPLLADEEAWDVAAYVLSLPHPAKDISSDWPDVSKKPVDHPFGPYADEFSEQQHKFGPFAPIPDLRKKTK
ncbi:MAG TPA: c-type cytochrome [Cyclobacteriaceae bacterium]|nr:c-type cytochrome [Cyclobacteriaceae bacterium]